MNESSHTSDTGTDFTEKLSAKMARIRRLSAGILAVAAAGLLLAVCYGVFAAVTALADDPNMFPPGETPTGFAARVAVLLQFSFAGPLLVLLAVMLLGGSLLLTSRVPSTPQGAPGQYMAGRASVLRLALIGLVAAAGLIALLYAAAAALVLIVRPAFPGPPALERGAMVVELALSLAAPCLLIVQVSWWIPHHPVLSPDTHDEQPEQDNAVYDATPQHLREGTTDLAAASIDVIETGRWAGRGTHDLPPSEPANRNVP